MQDKDWFASFSKWITSNRPEVQSLEADFDADGEVISIYVETEEPLSDEEVVGLFDDFNRSGDIGANHITLVEYTRVHEVPQEVQPLL